MPTKRISELPSASSTSGADLIPVVQGGVTKKVAASAVVPPGTFLDTSTTQTGVGTKNLEAIRTRFLPAMDPRHPAFGAVGDGVADDTAALQACIDACTGVAAPASNVRVAKYRIDLGANVIYRVTAPLRIHSVLGFRMEGSSRQTTFIRGEGSIDAVLDMNGNAYCTYGGFTVCSANSGTIQRAIDLYWDPAGSLRSTTGNFFYNVDVAACRCVTAFRIGRNGFSNQVDSTCVVSCNFYGQWTAGESTLWQNGVWCGSNVGGNNFLHAFYGCHSLAYSKNLINSLTGVTWSQGSLGNGGVDIYLANGAPSYMVAKDFRSESGERLLDCQQASTASSQIELENITFTANGIDPDGQWIKLLIGGLAKFRNLKIEIPGAVVPKIMVSSGGTPAVLDVDGLTTPNADVAAAFTLSNNANTVTVRRLCLTDGSGNVSSVDGGTWTGSRPAGTVLWRHSERATEQVKTADHILALHDAFTAIVMNMAGANNLTVPPNSSVAFPIGTEITVFQLGAGQTSIVAGSGVTLRSPGGALKLAAQYSTATVRKRATDEWVVSGDVVP